MDADHARGVNPYASRLHIIAEAGTNHAGKRDLAKRLIGIAAEARADSVKFQIIYPEGLYLPVTIAPDGTRTPSEVVAKRRAMMLSDDEYRKLRDDALELGIPMSASVFDTRGVRLVNELDAPYIKFASCDLDNSALLKTGAETGRKIILSTGMSTLGEVETAVADVLSTGNRDVVLLHCVSCYPATLAQMNLGFITTLRAAFGLPVGLSDHTEDSRASLMALALGATWFEKHCTYDRAAEGFDHAYAMEPAGLARYIADLREGELALRAPIPKVSKQEAATAERARRGVYAARDIAPGEILHDDDLLVVRPPNGTRPNEAALLVGRPVSVALHQHEPIHRAHVA